MTTKNDDNDFFFLVISINTDNGLELQHWIDNSFKALSGVESDICQVIQFWIGISLHFWVAALEK